MNISEIYEQAFGITLPETINRSYTISVADILNKNIGSDEIVDGRSFPILDKTLRHTFIYLYLRLQVEKKLIDIFSIATTPTMQLGEIIAKAFPNASDIGQIRNRTRLTSKKTLINEFNHFEGNLSIFQPAIDITDKSLGEERAAIDDLLRSIEREQA